MSEAVNHPAHYGGADNAYEAITWYLQREIEGHERTEAAQRVPGLDA